MQDAIMQCMWRETEVLAWAQTPCSPELPCCRYATVLASCCGRGLSFGRHHAFRLQQQVHS